MEIASKITGGTLDANEFNQIPDELENLISGTGQAPAAGDLFQVSKGVADYSAHGDFFTDSGAADAYVLSATGSKQSPTAYGDGMRIRFIVGNTNTGASTINVATLGAKAIRTPLGAVLPAGDLVVGAQVTLQYDDANSWFIIYDVATGGSTTTIFSEVFTSAEQTITAAGLLTIAHSLSSIPYLVTAYLICKTAELGYSIGDEVSTALSQQSSTANTNYGLSMVPDGTNLNVRYGSGTNVFFVNNKTTGAGTIITSGNWKLILRAWA